MQPHRVLSPRGSCSGVSISTRQTDSLASLSTLLHLQIKFHHPTPLLGKVTHALALSHTTANLFLLCSGPRSHPSAPPLEQTRGQVNNGNDHLTIRAGTSSCRSPWGKKGLHWRCRSSSRGPEGGLAAGPSSQQVWSLSGWALPGCLQRGNWRIARAPKSSNAAAAWCFL